MGFAHRGLHGPGVPENSMAAFRAAIDAGAGIECDVRLAGDGRPVVFHDHDLRRMCASGLSVEATSSAILARQKLFDSDQYIPRLRELLELVGGERPLLIELKARGGNAGRLAEAVVARLGDYEGPVGVMSFDPHVGKWLSRNAPHVRRGLVVSRRASAFDRWRCRLASKPDFMAIDHAALSCRWVANARRRHWIYSWTIRGPSDRETGEVHADALIWEGHGGPRN